MAMVLGLVVFLFCLLWVVNQTKSKREKEVAREKEWSLRNQVKLTLMLSPMKKAKPFEPDIDIILSELGAINLLKRYLCQFFNAIFHEELQGLFLKFDLLLRVDAFPVLFLQSPVTISFLHSRLQPRSLHLWSNRSHRWGGGRETCLGARRQRGGAEWRRETADREGRHGKECVLLRMSLMRLWLWLWLWLWWWERELNIFVGWEVGSEGAP